MMNDDLPWPELGNVSRGATRGNQGQKGCLGPADAEGRAILQLRVQPGVLAVRLNRQSSDWYRQLDNEVHNALKLTKTYWRKARRRQDYDARADQDHMELHEWLQQLKDKVMTHLELLMQKGEIQGPPYIMPEHLELSFLRKFVERQNSGIPHNPRLRQAVLEGRAPRIDPHYHSAKSSEGGSTPLSANWEVDDDKDSSSLEQTGSPVPFGTAGDSQGLLSEVRSSQRSLRHARAALARAQKDSTDAFIRYKSCLDVESRAMQQVVTAEERRDSLMSSLVARYNSMGIEVSEGSSRPQTASSAGHLAAVMSVDPSQDPVSAVTDVSPQDAVNQWQVVRDARWSRTHTVLPDDHNPAMPMHDADVNGSYMTSRKRSWDAQRDAAAFEDLAAAAASPPRKRYQLDADESIRTASPVRHPAVFAHNPISYARPEHHMHSIPNAAQHPHLLGIAV